MKTKVAVGLLGVLGTAGVMTAQPVAAAEAHDLHRSDTYQLRDRFGNPTSTQCTIDGSNVLQEDGSGVLSAHNDCGESTFGLNVFMSVSYVDTTGTLVQFSVQSDGRTAAAFVGDVASDLEISYQAAQAGGPGLHSLTYKLPK